MPHSAPTHPAPTRTHAVCRTGLTVGATSLRTTYFWIALANAMLIAGCGGEQNALPTTQPKPVAENTSTSTRDRPANTAAPANDSSSVSRTDATTAADNAPAPITPAPSPTAPSPPVPLDTIPTFAAIGKESGLDFVRYEDIRGQCRILESTGGGVAMIDIDADGTPDLMFPDGCVLPETDREQITPPRDQTTGGRLFRNLGNLQFRDITDACGIDQRGYGQGCAVGDFDNDGFDDLYITAFGRNTLARNNGDGTFTDITAAAGAEVPQWSTSAAFADVNQDGLLDLYVCNYLEEDINNPILCPSPNAPTGFVQCPPSKYEAQSDTLLLNLGDGTFWDATTASGIAALPRKALGVVIADLNGNGRPDIYVGNDGQPNSLFTATSFEPAEAATGDAPAITVMVPRYTESALTAGAALNRSGYAQASMGIAAGDINADQRLDLVLTHFYGDTNTVYENLGEGRFDDVTRRSRLAGPSRQVLGWGAVLRDFNLDQHPDLFVTNGHVEDRTWTRNPEPLQMPSQLFLNQGQGNFAEVTPWAGAPFQQRWQGRGVATGDLDGDGHLDLAISRINEPAVVLHNQFQTTKRVTCVRLVGRTSNRNAIGAVVTVQASKPPQPDDQTPVATKSPRQLPQTHWIIGGGSYLSASERKLHVIHTTETPAILTVQWPSGTVSTHTISAQSELLLAEPG